jgi:surface protein
MFYRATSFNQNIGSWTMDNIITMTGMFEGATSFNQYIGDWNVSNTQAMANMFKNATSFNQNISGWNVSNVTDMTGMFNGAIAFNQDISNWIITNVPSFAEFMLGKSTSNFSYYDNILNAWSQLTIGYLNIPFDMGSIQYTSAGATARQSLIDNYGWIISDGGQI